MNAVFSRGKRPARLGKGHDYGTVLAFRVRVAHGDNGLRAVGAAFKDQTRHTITPGPGQIAAHVDLGDAVAAFEYAQFIRAGHPGLNRAGGLQAGQDYRKRSVDGDFRVDAVRPFQGLTLNPASFRAQLMRAEHQHDDRPDAHDIAAPAQMWTFGTGPVAPGH